MDVTLGGMVTCVRPLQKRNAQLPMDLTLDGIVTCVKPLQPSKAQ
jgi:hypothetical protein